MAEVLELCRSSILLTEDLEHAPRSPKASNNFALEVSGMFLSRSGFRLSFAEEPSSRNKTQGP